MARMMEGLRECREVLVGSAGKEEGKWNAGV